MLKNFLIEAKGRESSDIHLVYNYPPMYRVDGSLRGSELYSELTKENLVEIVKELIGEDEYKKFEAIKEYDMAFEFEGIGRYRGNFHYQQESIGISLRKLNDNVPTLKELNLESKMSRFLNYQNGLILVTGETGSGKSTTLAALINEINQRESKHIITLEDPIEYVYKRKKALIEQREIGADSESFQSALKYILRQDPDVILIGELRDRETVTAAITAAETGHLVLATLHTNSAAKTIDRIIDVFPKEKQDQVKSQLSTILRGVVSQQLIPRVGGGRSLAQEILISTPAISNLIKEGDLNQIQSMMEVGAINGMITMEKSLEWLYREGNISEKDYNLRKGE